MEAGYTIENRFKVGQASILVSNYEHSNRTVNQGFYNEFLLKEIGFYHSVGMWRIKCVHEWKTNAKQQYQECKKCGKGHAL